MKAIEFKSKLRGDTLHVPAAVTEQLTEGRKARVIFLFDDDVEDAAWREGAYRQFLRDSTEDAANDRLR